MKIFTKRLAPIDRIARVLSGTVAYSASLARLDNAGRYIGTLELAFLPVSVTQDVP
jgi:hypothetical protein